MPGLPDSCESGRLTAGGTAPIPPRRALLFYDGSRPATRRWHAENPADGSNDSSAGVAAGTVWMARTAATIYGRSILRTGSRVRLRKALGRAPA